MKGNTSQKKNIVKGKGGSKEGSKKQANAKKTTSVKQIGKSSSPVKSSQAKSKRKRLSEETVVNGAFSSAAETENNEILGLIIVALGILFALSMYFEHKIIGEFGSIVSQFLKGILGITSYVIPIIILAFGIIEMFFNHIHSFKIKLVSALTLLIMISVIIQTGSFNMSEINGISHFNELMTYYEQGQTSLGGGLIGAAIALPFVLLFHKVGAMVIFVTIAIVLAMIVTDISFADVIRSIVRAIMSKNIKGSNLRKSNDELDEEIEALKFSGIISTEQNDIKSNSENKRKRVVDFRLEENTKSNQEQLNSKQIAPKQKDVATPLEEASEVNTPYEAQDDFKNDIFESMVWSSESQNVNREQHKIASEYTGAKIISSEKKNIEKPVSKSIKVEEQVNQKDTSNLNNKNISMEANNTEHVEFQYSIPPFDLLSGAIAGGLKTRDLKNAAVEGAKKLEMTLKSFGVDAKIINVSVGPAITRYEIQPSPGVKVSKIVNLSDDIALNLAAIGVRIAPIPGKAAIGIEVPNAEVAPIGLREVIETNDFMRFDSKLAVGLGKDVSGQNMIIDIGKMPHLLIAGATGSGKSVCINTLIVSLLYKANPNEVKLLMIDPKVVELGVYNGIPHLLIPVVTDPRKAAGALNWAVQEMVERYKSFADKGVRDIAGYNAQLRENGEEGVLPHVVIIIDELADLMMVAPHDVEDAICRLAQMARAAGMHLVIATQRPSVNVITGVIKANIPSRIAFAVSSQVDSRTILDMAGAEKLTGKGDMLYYPVGASKPMRAKGAFVSDKEVERIVEHIKSQARAQYDEHIIEGITDSQPEEQVEDNGRDEFLSQAIESVVEVGQASVSFIQRKFKVGYARAGRIIDQMEERGIISGYEGSKPRVLISKMEWEEMKLGSGEG